MALLSRLFSTRKFNRNQNSLSCEKNERSSWKPFTFNKDQIRVLLFRECDWRGRKLLFDSQAVQKVVIEKACKLGFASRQKVDKNKKDAFVEVTNGFGYQYTKPSSDATLIGEMMFGAVAMTFRGTAMKVHSMPNPNRLMCTKVFPSSEISHCKRRSSLEDSLGSSLNSMSDPEAESCARDVPQSSAGDSGFCGDLSLRSVSSVGSWTPLNSPAGSRNSLGSMGQSGGSLSSLQRRWVRSMSTSLEHGHESVGECAATTTSVHRRTRLGLCVIVTLTEEQRREMESFIFEHISVIETMVERLRLAVERAYVRKDMFVHVVHEGWQEMQQSFHDLFCLPRLVLPMWPCLGVNAANCPHSLANSFLQDLCQLIGTLDTKATNFFVSTLVTGVLTHHLGWVNSVWSSSAPPMSTSSTNVMPQSLSELSKSHPYNPLWAQLGDLYGALGSPGKTAKTIITSAGRKHDCVNKLLSVMSYFIRCGEVKEAVNLRYDCAETSPAISRRGRLSSFGKELPESSASDIRSTIGTSSQTLSDVSQTVFGHEWNTGERCLSDKSLCSVETTVSASPQLTEFVSPLLTVCLTPEKRKAEPSANADDVQKRLNITMDILNREMERCKRERKGKGRNFCSPAGAEWETEEFDGVGRESVEREVSRLGDGSCANASGCFDASSERLRNGGDVIERVGTTEGICRNRFDYTLATVGHKIDEKSLKRDDLSSNSVKMELRNGFHSESKASEGHDKESDRFHQAGGLRSMKRSTSCRNQLGDLTSGVGLYPDIEELAKMENIRLCDNYTEESKTDLHLDHISTGVIAEKVNALCRVPTSAVSFHFESQIQTFEAHDCKPHDSKRIEAEKQMAALDSRLNLQQSHGTEVVFFLGDDVEPKGLRRRSTLSLNNHVTKTDSEIKNSSSQEQVTKPKVVTVRSSLIDLEDERGNLKTDCDGKSFLSPFENSVDVKSSISRSSSINFPIAKRNCVDKVAKVFRRHTEIYCDRCKLILKERRSAKPSDSICENRREFFSCEKCFYSQRDHGVVEGQAGLRRSRSEKVNAIDGLDDKNVVEESSLESEGQDHAVFEEYNPSDEEMVASSVHCGSKCDADLKEFGFEDLHLVELQVPSCAVTDHLSVGLAGSLLGGSSPRYVPDLLLQGCISPPVGWEAELRRDLQLAARSSALGSDVTEAVCLVADTQTWEVHLVSSHTYVVDRPGTLGVRVGMSQLVANMLESLALLYRLKTPPHHCLSHLESKMKELLMRSHALAELLLSTEFCSMRLLTSTLDLDPNDVPLLLAVASTHTPHISQRYGLSFV